LNILKVIFTFQITQFQNDTNVFYFMEVQGRIYWGAGRSCIVM